MLDGLKEKSVEELIEVKKEIMALISKKQKERKRELKNKFQEMAEEAGLTITEIVQTKPRAKVKYKKGNKTWSGHGRRPAWILDLEKNGEDLTTYLV